MLRVHDGRSDERADVSEADVLAGGAGEPASHIPNGLGMHDRANSEHWTDEEIATVRPNLFAQAAESDALARSSKPHLSI